MSESLKAAAEALSARLNQSGFDGSVKFEIENEGTVRIVGADVSLEDGDADCTISASMDTLKDMFAGDLDPTAAFMTGKIKIDGDMGVAMKLGQLLA